MEITIRAITLDDAAPVAALLRSNRTFLAPWDPIRPDDFFTDDGQRDLIAEALARDANDPHVILVDGRIAGRINLNNIVRGPFLSASLGYWVDQEVNGHGVATTAVAMMLRHAFGPAGLHRVEAGTLVHNVASQRALERNGFQRFGLAPRYLRIAGRWQDHLLFQRLAGEP
jgi:ribosomal-protein-alanine N-acetyltransferase